MIILLDSFPFTKKVQHRVREKNDMYYVEGTKPKKENAKPVILLFIYVLFQLRFSKCQ